MTLSWYYIERMSTGVYTFAVVLVAAILLNQVNCGQLCVSCSEADDPSKCQNFVTCDNNEVCFLHKYRTDQNQSKYDAGCTYPELCRKQQSTGTIFGKRSTLHSHIVCQSCCNDTRLCNTNMDCKEPTSVQGISCLACNGVDSPTGCNRETACSAGEICYIHKYRTANSGRDLYDLGCKHPSLCIHKPSGMFGRRQQEGHKMICESCCSNSAFCNRNLQCSHHDQKPFNSSCTTSSECQGHLVCDNKKCLCPSDNYYWSGMTCEIRKAFNVNCMSTYECQGVLECHNGKCQCPSTSHWDGNRCTPRLGYQQLCYSTDTCKPTLYCIHNQCKCDADQDYWTGSSCVPKKKINATCSTYKECSGNLQCMNNRCVCTSINYGWNGFMCVEKKLYNATCSTTSECDSNLQCISNKCVCSSQKYSWKGNKCMIATPKECADIEENISGVYTIYPQGLLVNKVSVYCIMEHGLKWTVIQKRENFTLSFYKTWNEYKAGFGSPDGEYWLGNDNIYQLSNDGKHKLAIYLKSKSVVKYANYSGFYIEDENNKYTIRLSGYSGDAGDQFNDSNRKYKQNGMKFTTKDQDNDNLSSDNCATGRLSGWWYAACDACDLNKSKDEPFWYEFDHIDKTIMMIARI